MRESSPPRRVVVFLLLVGLTALVAVTAQALIVGIVSPVQPMVGTLGLLAVAFALASQRS